MAGSCLHAIRNLNGRHMLELPLPLRRDHRYTTSLECGATTSLPAHRRQQTYTRDLSRVMCIENKALPYTCVENAQIFNLKLVIKALEEPWRGVHGLKERYTPG